MWRKNLPCSSSIKLSTRIKTFQWSESKRTSINQYEKYRHHRIYIGKIIEHAIYQKDTHMTRIAPIIYKVVFLQQTLKVFNQGNKCDL